VATLIRSVSSAEEMFEWKFENATRIDLQVSHLHFPPFWMEGTAAPLEA
jgi:hypothetical protein